MPMTKVMYPELSADKFYPGLFFRNCTVTAADGVADGAYYLGRPWKETCGAMFIDCKLPKAINAKGWKDWSGSENKASLYEYKSIDAATGSLADVSSRASFSHQATDAEVEAYMNPKFLFAKYKDEPFDYEKILRGAAAPMNFVVTPNEISWESDDNAAGYIIYKDGASFVSPPTAPSPRMLPMMPDTVWRRYPGRESCQRRSSLPMLSALRHSLRQKDSGNMPQEAVAVGW